MLNTYTDKNVESIFHTHQAKQIIAEDCWAELTLAQQFSARSLSQYGYTLAFIRTTKPSRYAVVRCGEEYATISVTGEIDMSPSIETRKEQR